MSDLSNHFAERWEHYKTLKVDPEPASMLIVAEYIAETNDILVVSMSSVAELVIVQKELVIVQKELVNVQKELVTAQNKTNTILAEFLILYKE